MKKVPTLTCAAMAVLAGAAWSGPAPADRVTDAEVVAVLPDRGPDRGSRGPARVTIRLEDGTRYRLWLRPPLPRVGARLPVRILAEDGRAREVERAR